MNCNWTYDPQGIINFSILISTKKKPFSVFSF